MQTPMMSCHIIPMWNEWNANTDDMMMMWFANREKLKAYTKAQQATHCWKIHFSGLLVGHASEVVEWNC